MGKSRKLSDRLNFARTYKINWKQSVRCRNSSNLESRVKKFQNLDALFQRRIQRKFTKSQATKPTDIICPAECFARKVSANRNFKIKGVNYSLEKLLQLQEQEQQLQEQSTVYIFRLAPEHYHRIHAPTASKIVDIKEAGGNYHSVNPIMLHSSPVLQENYRKIITFENGLYLVAVGATCVGSVHLTVNVGTTVTHGQDMGTFGFGGSCLVLVVPTVYGSPPTVYASQSTVSAQEKHLMPGVLL
jgi:phosphatidylserine decarboxylase